MSDLWEGPPDASPDMRAGILKLRAERELKFATCPRCSARNPIGVHEQKTEGREWRIGFFLASLALGIGIWFYPPLAWLLVAIDGFVMAVIVYAVRRTGAQGRAVRSAVMSVVVFAAIVATAIFYRRWVALFALYMTFQVARRKQDPDEAWELAKKKLLFAEPYR